MKQLLTWCGTRAMVGKPPVSGKDRDAALAGISIPRYDVDWPDMNPAREIQSQLLKDFSTKSSLSDWFSRVSKSCFLGVRSWVLTLLQEDEPVLPSPPKPNPKNAANQTKIKELEGQLAQYVPHSAGKRLLVLTKSTASNFSGKPSTRFLIRHH